MESTESRFAHLLQPIRELTKNWDVDVASQLNDYLDEQPVLIQAAGSDLWDGF
uniref:Condensin-2 complex subunit H2 n=1 Tax=Oryzias melastigma TaxID=30732 RepID=A0A3B3C811_ORYME